MTKSFRVNKKEIAIKQQYYSYNIIENVWNINIKEFILSL